MKNFAQMHLCEDIKCNRKIVNNCTEVVHNFSLCLLNLFAGPNSHIKSIKMSSREMFSNPNL